MWRNRFHGLLNRRLECTKRARDMEPFDVCSTNYCTNLQQRDTHLSFNVRRPDVDPPLPRIIYIAARAVETAFDFGGKDRETIIIE
jgi:hypothetical protein